MMRKLITIWLLVLFMAVVPALAGLEPNQVLVVYNSRIPQSAELADHYKQARRVPSRNLIALELPQSNQMTYDEYVNEIRDPIRRVILERRLEGVIKCVCLIKGVPMVISQHGDKLQRAYVERIYHQAGSDAYKRMKNTYRYTWNVGQDFTGTPDGDLDKLQQFFDSPAGQKIDANPDVVLSMFIKLIAKKQMQADMLSLKLHRRIANRQILALVLEMMGTEGLVGYMIDSHLSDTPEFARYRKITSKLENELFEISRKPASRETIQRKLEIIGQLKGAHGVLAEARKYSDPLKAAKPVKIHPANINSASVDSEIMLLWYNVEGDKRYGPIKNRLYKNLATNNRRVRVLLTGRIDSLTYLDAKNMIDAPLNFKGSPSTAKVKLTVAPNAFAHKDYKQNPAYKKYSSHRKIEINTTTPSKTGDMINIFSLAGNTQIGWPDMDVFFKSFVEDKLTLAESYGVSQKYTSWLTIIAGDPLLKIK